MCHNTSIESSQIEKFVENGMPQKIVKAVMYSMKKRRNELKKSQQEREEQQPITVDQQFQITQTDSFINSTPVSSTSSASLSFNSLKTKAFAPISELKATPIKLDHNKNITIESSKQMTTAPPSRAACPFTGRLSQDKISSLDGNSTISAAKAINNAEVYVDALTVSTQYTKQFARRLTCTIEKLQRSKLYTILTKTTQPAHLVAVCILSFVLLTVWPDLIDNANPHGNNYESSISEIHSYGNLERNNNNHNYKLYKNCHNTNKSSTLIIIAYLGAFAVHFGAQIWMTFVSGLSLYFSLPRHTFGECQQILFPKYFALNSILSIGMLIMFVKYFMNNWIISGWIQLVALSMISVIEVIVRLYLAPPMLRLMLEKYKIEGTVGSGKEIGSIAQGDLLLCPHYQRIHKSFRRIHMTVAIGNMIVLLASCQHLCFLASKIQIS